ncbi:MerR family transcriptional regulator [Saccharopolyspora sp. NFXS83]|uniref:MerR family transcriptional regulator n=1 Tax=Saccharopolyspora sp. NFXS83 TaxID=2993560 RepID=UPI00224A5000|nr:MerR family transcriptional regulator [Saccharopolyspora sp. NFXS83]MCX2732971.1 MerR family transcriptional regulator [Saccharopolyspora sp. NFXS83]
MRIGDAAAAAGTTPRTLRFYEQRGLLDPAPRTATGQRTYRPRDVARVRIIRQLLALGLTVADVASMAAHLHVVEGDSLPGSAVPFEPGGRADLLRQAGRVAAHRLAALDAQISRLSAFRDDLAACHAHFEALDSAAR